MQDEAYHRKVTGNHLQRDAYVYIRQSSMGQVLNNRESTMRQYDFRRQAVALGWQEEQIRVIDCDQGESGAVKDARDGFAELVADVSMGRAGIVMALEASRLSRNSSDWHRLLELCAFTDTLVMDQDGLYELANFNDRLLLGLKGVMSEAELHVLKSRMLQGLRNKARRGELKTMLPTGLAYDPAERVVLDPDQEVQHALRSFFDSFARTGSATATVRDFRRQALRFPRRTTTGGLAWTQLTQSLALGVLHNPRYAGAFCFGRKSCRIGVGGQKRYRTLPRDQWQALVKDMHPGYITWEQYEENLRRLAVNANAHGQDRRRSPPREGPALLQGLAICGVCGQRMSVRYHSRNKRLIPDYVCQNATVGIAARRCQDIPGATIEKAMAELVLESVTPMNLEIAVQVQRDIESRVEQADQLRGQHVERARYEADLAKRRFMQVEPENRLVADVLEAEWNDKLRSLAEAQALYEKQREADRELLSEEQRRTIMELATDLPRLWNAPETCFRDRKRIVRLLIEDVTIIREDLITLHVRFRGGATRTLRIAPPLSALDKIRTPPQTVSRVRNLLEEHTDAETARILNEEGLRSGSGRPFTRVSVKVLRRNHRLTTQRECLLQKGFLSPLQIAERLGIRPDAVASWRRKGVLRGISVGDNGQHLYAPPDQAVMDQVARRRKCTPRADALNPLPDQH